LTLTFLDWDCSFLPNWYKIQDSKDRISSRSSNLDIISTTEFQS
jgi:hypothetical protein